MPLNPQLGNSPQTPATINAGSYPPVETPGEPLVAFGTSMSKSLGRRTMRRPKDFQAYQAPKTGQSVAPRPRIIGP